MPFSTFSTYKVPSRKQRGLLYCTSCFLIKGNFDATSCLLLGGFFFFFFFKKLSKQIYVWIMLRFEAQIICLVAK